MESTTEVMEDEEEREDDGNGEEVRWGEMLMETLVEVIKRLPWTDRLLTMPVICKAWRKASYDPSCWQYVDLKEWCIMFQQDEVILRMLKLAVERSCGGIQELHLGNLQSDACLRCLGQSGLNSLKTLCIASSTITDDGVCEMVPRLPALAYLDIGKCSNLTQRSLEVIGQSCKSLTRLDRSMWFLNNASLGPSDDSEALAIAQNMPKLKHLEMVSGFLSNVGLMAILDGCPDLEYLDVRCCWNIKFTDPVLVSKCEKLAEFLISGPKAAFEYEDDEEDDDDDDVDDWDYTTELWEDFDYLEDYLEEDYFS